MAKHIPGLMWGWRKPGKYPNGYVSTASPQELKLEIYPEEDKPGFAFTISRGDAKLLARRITQCLERTK
jgi:hypothetical protein